MKISVYNKEGETSETMELPKEIFDVPFNSDLVHQVVVAQMANKRHVIAHTKDRSEVSGGGKKPWRQKGTGRARHGSIRSPLWKGGGVTFGPTKERNFKKDLNKKMRRKALAAVLSEKARRKLLFLVDEISLESPKTKVLFSILSKLPSNKEKTLLLLPTMDKNVLLASQNLPYIKTMQARDVSVLDILSTKYVVLEKKSVKVIEGILLKKEEKEEKREEKKVEKPKVKKAKKA